MSNPCLNGAACTPYGKSSYYCTCPVGCKGVNCENCYDPSSSGCIDYNPTNCQYYASQGYCSSNGYILGIPILNYCAQSCNACN